MYLNLMKLCLSTTTKLPKEHAFVLLFFFFLNKYLLPDSLEAELTARIFVAKF